MKRLGRKCYRWKCQHCGFDWTRNCPDEPRICPACRDKGAKSFRGEERDPVRIERRAKEGQR